MSVEKDFRSFSGGDFNLTSTAFRVGTLSITSGADVNIGSDGIFFTKDFFLQAAGNIQVDNSLWVTQISSLPYTTGLNISVIAGGALHVAADLKLDTDPTRSGEAGGNILVTSGADMTIGGIFAIEDFWDWKRRFGKGGNITLSSGGTLSVSGDATFRLFNGAEVTNNSSPTFDIRAESLFVGGFLDALIQNYDGSIVGNAGIKFTLSGSLMAQRGASFGIISNVEFVGPLSIVGNAGIDIVAGSFAGLSLSAFIDTQNGGSIGGFAAINGIVSGEVNIGSDASFLIVNDTNTDTGEGGTIGSNAEINVHAGSFSADSLQASISNGGSIGQDAIVNFETFGDINVQSDAVFQILNSAQDAGNGSGSNAGIIGGNALLDVSATNISSAGLLQVIIDTHGNGMIGGDAMISLNAASVSAGSLQAFLFDYAGGDISGNALISFDVSGNISSGQ